MNTATQPASPFTARRGFAMALLTAGLYLLGFLAGSSHAQTWIVDAEEPDFWARSIDVSPYGDIAIVRDSSAVSSGVTMLDPIGQKEASYDLKASDGSSVFLRDGIFLPDGSLGVCGSAGNRPWVASISPWTGKMYWSTTLTDGSQTGRINRMMLNGIGHLVLQGELYANGLLPWRGFMAAVDPATDGGTKYRRELPEYPGSGMYAAANGEMVMVTGGPEISVSRTSDWGNYVWHSFFLTSESQYAPRVAESADGDIFVLGVTQTSVGRKFQGTRISPDGKLLWQKGYFTFPALGSALPPLVHSLQATSDGGFVAALGQPTANFETQDAALLRLDANGDALWLKSFGVAAVDDWAVDVVETPDGGYVALANVQDVGMRIARFTADGEIQGCGTTPMAVSDFTPVPLSSLKYPFSYTSYGGLWGSVQSTADSVPTFVTDICGNECEADGDTYGSGTPGSGGFVPFLAMQDGYCLAYTPTVYMYNVVGGTYGLMLLNFSPWNGPGLGGTVHVNPFGMKTLPIQVGGLAGQAGTGSVLISTGTDLTAFQGLDVYMQAVFADANGPDGLTLSNGLEFSIH